MYRVIKLGCVLPEDQKKLIRIAQKNFLDDIINALDGFEPKLTSYSIRWLNWIAEQDLRTCFCIIRSL